MQATADVFLNCTSDLHMLVLTNVLEVPKPPSFALGTHDLKPWVLCEEQVKIVSKLKLQKSEYRYFE